jgi:hypothetical protein
VAPRRQRILAPDGVYAVAVVRVEAERGFVDSNFLRAETADAVLRAAVLPGVRGVQVDFDATDSQRDFYAEVLRRVRARLPRGSGPDDDGTGELVLGGEWVKEGAAWGCCSADVLPAGGACRVVGRSRTLVPRERGCVD